jgi:hypothetical protein
VFHHFDSKLSRLCPATLRYQVGTPAAFEVACLNGRPLGGDAFAAMLATRVNRPSADGVAPPADGVSSRFPHFGHPYTAVERAALTPVSTGFGAQG